MTRMTNDEQQMDNKNGLVFGWIKRRLRRLVWCEGEGKGVREGVLWFKKIRLF